MPYIASDGSPPMPNGLYDMSAFSAYYARKNDAGTAWGVYGSQIDFSNESLLQDGYPDARTAQTALEQVLTVDSPVRQFPPP
jgi:hypothetical protein